MGTFWRLVGWIALCLGAVIAGTAVAFLVTRRHILRHVQEELGRESMLLVAAARVGADNGSPSVTHISRVAGILMLLSSGLYFHSWAGGREVFIPGPSISWIGVSDPRDGPRTDRHRIVVRFLNASGKEDGVAIRLLYPEQWVDAIKTHLITRTS